MQMTNTVEYVDMAACMFSADDISLVSPDFHKGLFAATAAQALITTVVSSWQPEPRFKTTSQTGTVAIVTQELQRSEAQRSASHPF